MFVVEKQRIQRINLTNFNSIKIQLFKEELITAGNNPSNYLIVCSDKQLFALSDEI